MNSAEVFAPGEFLKDELEARGWTQAELGEIMGRPTRLVNELVCGKRAITPETAVQLADALGTSPDLWMNLESQYQLSKVRTPRNAVARRAALYAKFPVRDIIKRGWVSESESIDVLEQNFAAYFGVTSLESLPKFAHAAKKSLPETEVSYIQLAWLFRAKALASTQQSLPQYNENKMRDSLPRLRALMSATEEARHVPRILFECGVHFVLVEALKGSKIDGACFWLNDSQPVVAMSLRLDRIDNFWFVLRHEIEHVLQRHGQDVGYVLDQDIEIQINPEREQEEQIANAEASNFCVERNELSNFIARVQPMFSEERILRFANRLQTHPGIVIGQLHNALKRHDLLRKHLVKVAHIVNKTALSDGWGLIEHI